MTDEEFWIAMRRAIKGWKAALDGKPGAPDPHTAAKDALAKMSTAIERRYDISAKE